MARIRTLGWLAPLALLAGGCASRTTPSVPPLLATRFTAGEGAARVADRAAVGVDMLGGLHTFDSAPLDSWSRAYDIADAEAWLQRIRLATVRFGSYCSGAFVSPEGLVLTAQACVRECIRATSPGGRDDLATGVHARRHSEERLCPGIRIDQLIHSRDVTDEIRRAMAAEPTVAAAETARRATIARMEWSCGAERAVVCEVVPLYGGARLHLYEYRRYNVVKLVFAPELQAAWFGGRFDGYAWPRFSMDFALARVYEPDGRQPARTPAWLRLRTDSPAEGDPLFIAGSAGSTYRHLSLSQLAYERDVRHPQMVRMLEGLSRILTAASGDEEIGRLVRDDLFTVETSLEGYRAQLEALHDTLLVGSKIRWERDLRSRIAAVPALDSHYGDVWTRLEGIQRRKTALTPRLNASNVSIVGVPHLRIGTELVRYINEMEKAPAERQRMYTGESLERIEGGLTGATDIRPDLAREFLAVYVDLLAFALVPGDRLLSAALRNGETPEEAARRMTGDSRLLDPIYRRQLMRTGAAGIRSSPDPLLRLAFLMDSTYTALQPEWLTLQQEERRQRERLGAAILAVHGEGATSDASDSPRIAEGRVLRYGQAATLAPPFTTFHGMFDRAASFGWDDVFALPASFQRRRDALRMDTPIGFVLTADAAGSGAAVVDAGARLAGIVHDTNLAHLRNRFAFVHEDGRAIAVHAAGILEALRSVYRAQSIIDELQGRQ